MRRLLLLLPTTTYRADAFLQAARRLSVEVVTAVASERTSTLEARRPDRLLTLDFTDPQEAVRVAARFAREYPVDAVVPVDDDTAVIAAAIAEALSLPHNTLEAATAARNKHRMREILYASGVPVPVFQLLSIGDDIDAVARRVDYPCVLKPLFLSASRGVIRANDPHEFVTAFWRIAAILDEPSTAKRDSFLARHILVEEFIPGVEVALEGLLIDRELRVLALFDKPDRLDGPFFEETIYVTPSGLPDATQREIAACTARAASALGLRTGPIHAELRINPKGVWVVEVAARPIGGLCSHTLRFATGLSLEDIVIRHALGQEVGGTTLAPEAAGVMMIPIPRAGILRDVRGVASAKSVHGIEDIAITQHVGQKLVPLPEGSHYLGFIFARSESAERVVAALREAHGRLEIIVDPSPMPEQS